MQMLLEKERTSEEAGRERVPSMGSMRTKERPPRPGRDGCLTRVVVNTSGADPKFVVMNARLRQSEAFDRSELYANRRSLYATRDRQLCGRGVLNGIGSHSRS